MSDATPHFAPIVVLLFLGTVLLIGLSLFGLLYGVLRKSPRIAAIGGVLVVAIVSGYAIVLFGFSLFSSEIILPAGGKKYFCEIDCHLAYSIARVQTAAHGNFVIVSIKTWFDPRTISPHRGDSPLTPNPRRVVLTDDGGHVYSPSSESELVLRPIGNLSTPITQSLRPGESYTSDFVFDVPQEARGLRLLITEDDSETRFIIGHENSFLHKKMYLGLGFAASPGVQQQPFARSHSI
ncbi:MAG: hypothetical protein NVS9B13_12370 [Candidatus Acidiferrum sp.]